MQKVWQEVVRVRVRGGRCTAPNLVWDRIKGYRGRDGKEGWRERLRKRGRA